MVIVFIINTFKCTNCLYFSCDVDFNASSHTRTNFLSTQPPIIVSPQLLILNLVASFQLIFDIVLRLIGGLVLTDYVIQFRGI